MFTTPPYDHDRISFFPASTASAGNGGRADRNDCVPVASAKAPLSKVFRAVLLPGIGFALRGLTVIYTADAGWIAMIGTAIAGMGFSLVFPSLGLEAIRRGSRANRGIAMGAYNAFVDLTLGIGSPALGFLAGSAGIGSVFAASAAAAVLAIPLTFHLQRRER